MTEINQAIPFTRRHEAIMESHTIKFDEHRRELSRLGVLMEEQRSDSRKMLEILGHIQLRFDRQDVLEERVKNLDGRVAAIEDFLRR